MRDTNLVAMRNSKINFTYTSTFVNKEDSIEVPLKEKFNKRFDASVLREYFMKTQ